MLYCQSGRRSQLAMNHLSKNGFNYLFNIDGGLYEWKKLSNPYALPLLMKNNRYLKFSLIPQWQELSMKQSSKGLQLVLILLAKWLLLLNIKLNLPENKQPEQINIKIKLRGQ